MLYRRLGSKLIRGNTRSDILLVMHQADMMRLTQKGHKKPFYFALSALRRVIAYEPDPNQSILST